MNRRELVFKAMSWVHEDRETDMIIHVSGMSSEGKTVQIQIEKFTPFCYLQLPKRITWTKEKCKALFNYFVSNHKSAAPLNYSLKKKKNLYFRKDGNFMLLTFATNDACRKFESKCSKKQYVPNVGMFNLNELLVHEHNIDPVLKIASMKNILLSGWVKVIETIAECDEDLSEDDRKFSYADVDMYVNYQDIHPYEMKEHIIVTPMYCSFDIECYSVNHNSKLPDPKIIENEVFQIALVFGKMGSDEEQKTFLLTRYNPYDTEGCKTFRFKTEKMLLLFFTELIKKMDPLFFIGYNIMKFDWDYMISRADKLGILDKFLELTRIIGKKATIDKINWSSSAYKQQEFRYPGCIGRIHLDVLIEVERNFKLPTYSLNVVAGKFLGEQKDDISPRQLFMFYKITKELLPILEKEILSGEKLKELQKRIKEIFPFRQSHGIVRKHRRHMLNCSTQEELTRLVRECLTMTLKYCRQDTILPIKIIEKLNLLTTMEEMSNVMHIPMSYLHTRGQQIKVLAQVFRETIHNGIIIPHHRKVKGAPKENYEGAIVAEAHAGDYRNVGTLDFCLSGNTLIATESGCSVPLKNITDKMKVCGWDGETYGWYNHKGLVYKGEKETVKVWLQDGSTITCTPDHKFMLDNGEWCRAGELNGKYVKCGIEQPLDDRCEKEKEWCLLLEDHLLRMETEEERENALAFARLVGYILSDGSIYETTDKNGRTRKCCEVSMGTMIDAKNIMKDIIRFNVPEVNIRKRSRGLKGTTYCITIPASLSKSIHSIKGIVVGKRATQPMRLPDFILHERCPKSIQREFLAGLFGGDGTAPFYQKGRSSSFGPLVLKWTTIEKYKDDMFVVFKQMQTILVESFGITSELLSKKVKYGASSIKPKDFEEENARWDLSIALSTEETMNFQEKIAFRYCINKSMRLSLASSFYKVKDSIRKQCSKVNDLMRAMKEKNQINVKLEKARKIVFSNEPILDDLSLSSAKLVRSKETKLRIEHITTEDYIEQTKTSSWFNMGEGTKYGVSPDSEIIPSFRKKVVGVFDNGVQDVYDIFEVEKVHNFLAGGITGSNCSLYPTTMIAFNICYSTLATDPSIPDEDCHILKWISHVGCEHDPKKRKKKDKDGNNIVICGEFRHRFLKVKLSYDEKTKTIHRENEGVMPKLERNLLSSRSEVKKEMLKAEARLKMTRGEASEDDLTFYKFKKFEIIPKGHLSKEEEKKLDVYVGVLNAKQLAIKVSANSTAATTPIPCLVNDKLEYRYIEELFDEDNFEIDEDGNEVCKTPKINAKVWSDAGWSDIKYVFRHKLSSKDQLKRVLTHTGIVDVTKDHSLLDQNKKEVTVDDVDVGDELFHMGVPLPMDTPKIPKNYIFDDDDIIPNKKNRIDYISNEIINKEYSTRLLYFEKNILSRSGRVPLKNSLDSSILFYLLRSLGYAVTIISPEELEYSVYFDNKEKRNAIVSISSIASHKEEYVYDIETSSHHFAAGVGDLIVHNSAYGALGAGDGFIPLIAGAASVTAMGRDLITSAIKKIRDTWSNCKPIYGDSVTGDTPITIRDSRTFLVYIIPISQFSDFLRSMEKDNADVVENWKEFPLFKLDGEDRRDKERIDVSHFEIWGNGKWFSIKRLIRHKVNKKIYRVQTGNGVVDVTEDHSLLTEKEEIIKPKDVKIGDRLLTSFPQIFPSFYKIQPKLNEIKEKIKCNKCLIEKISEEFHKNTKICKSCRKNASKKGFIHYVSEYEYFQEKEVTIEEAWVWGFFMADGSCGSYKVKSGHKYSWAINNQNLDFLNKAKKIIEIIEPHTFKILDTLKSSGVYKLVPVGGLKLIVQKYRKLFYNEKKKIVPLSVLNGSFEIRQSFFDGYYTGDGCKEKDEYTEFTAKNKLSCHQLYYLAKSLGYDNLCIREHTKKDDIYSVRICKTGKKRNDVRKKRVIHETYDDYVYDIETESGQFHAGLGEIILKNTDSCMIVFESSNLRESFDLCKKASRVVTHYLKSRILGYDENLVLVTKSGKEFTLDKIAPFSNHFEELEYSDKIKVLEYDSIPTDLSFECMYGRFLLLTKKRYIAYKVNEDGQVVDITKKGVVLSRRDNSLFLKIVYKYVSDGILNMKSEEEVMYTLYDEIHKLFTRRVPDTNLIIPVGVNKLIDYAKKKKYTIGEKEEVFFIDKNGDPIEEPNGPLDPRLVYPNLPQVLLSLKMIRRGTDVPSNTRLEQIFLENKHAIHQGDKAEDYTYYKENRMMEGLKIDYLHYIDKIQEPIMELLNVKYPRTIRVHYEKPEDAIKRVLGADIEPYKRSKIASTSSFVKEVPKYKNYFMGWDALEDKTIKKMFCVLPPIPHRTYLFKGILAKVEYVLSSCKRGESNDFTMEDPVEAEIIEVCKKYKAKCIIDALCTQFKCKKRVFRKPTQFGNKIIKNTGIYFIKGEHKGNYGFIIDLHLIENMQPSDKEKKYLFDIGLEHSQEILYKVPRDHFTTYHLKDSRIMKDIYDARCNYKKVVEEFKDLTNSVILPEDI